MERKIGCNLLYHLKEGKSGAKPERIIKSKRLHCLTGKKKSIRKPVGFPAVTGLDEVKSLLQSRLLWYWDTKEAEQGRGVQRRDRENKFEWNKKDKTLKETSEFMSIKVYLNGESVKLSVVENITHLGSCTEQS